MKCGPTLTWAAQTVTHKSKCWLSNLGGREGEKSGGRGVPCLLRKTGPRLLGKFLACFEIDPFPLPPLTAESCREGRGGVNESGRFGEKKVF